MSPNSISNLKSSERIRHVAVAIIIACIVAASTILRPLDITVWSLQSKMFDREASGEIVLAHLNDVDHSDVAVEGEIQIRKAIAAVASAGAERIFVDVAAGRKGSTQVDLRSQESLNQFGDRVILMRSEKANSLIHEGDRTAEALIVGGVPDVSSSVATDFLGYVWKVDRNAELENESISSLAFALNGDISTRNEVYPDYSIDPATVPTYELSALFADPIGMRPAIEGKTVVIDATNLSTRLVRIPGAGSMPAAMVHILGAETLKRDSGQEIHWFVILTIFGLIMFAGLSLRPDQLKRRILYGMMVTSLIGLSIAFAAMGMRVIITGPLAFLFVFTILRLVAGYKRRHLLTDPRSKLPNFAALQRDLSDDEEANLKAIVVAKIARLDAVFATLRPVDQGNYLRQVASRIALRDACTTVYYDGGKYFAFAITPSAYPNLQNHLDGLRAVNCQPVCVAGRLLDVSITMGVDRSSNQPVGNRLSSAIAASDQAREAYKPVFIIGDSSTPNEIWDFSLQARLEQALAHDQISVRLQPQICLKSMRIVGAEALARWHDIQKGEIPPADFVRQCERVGRLDELTKRIVGKTFVTMDTLRTHGHFITFSFNASAIQFVDYRIVDLIAQSLAKTGLDPRQFTIEITETARIDDLRVAREVLEVLKSQGFRLAMDDFGIQSANLEPLLELPFDQIKIDKTFVGQMQDSHKASVIVSNAIRLIQEAGMTSVAEGIEDKSTLDLVRSMGCDIGQGFHLARPLTPEELSETLNLQRDTPLLNRKFG